MRLLGVEIVGERAGRSDIVVLDGRITQVADADAGAGAEAGRAGDPSETVLRFDEAIAFPGLVNSHDHLEFDLYPALGHRVYRDVAEWGRDIHARDAAPIAAVEAVPRAVRVRWGALKNVLGGVTTVAHHGPSFPELAALPIGCAPGTSIHSVRLGRHWRWTLSSPFRRPPFVLHVAEGLSEETSREAAEVGRWNLFGRELVGVHAIAMRREQARRFRALVWCPLSNEFLFGKTADIRALKGETTILFGTDSTLTADWNLWNHLRRARAIGALGDRELYDAVTGSAATVWRRADAGRLAAGAAADLVVARKKCSDRWDAFYAIEPEDILLVVRSGAPVMVDASLGGAVAVPAPFARVRVGGATKLVAEDVGGILAELRRRGVTPNLPIQLDGASVDGGAEGRVA